ncbi:MAG: transglycosylase SLT domain-containing protein [Marinobacterium sp.]|nr:transglycosylase SLT domain-containing protein [Marinobacterium sp.]
MRSLCMILTLLLPIPALATQASLNTNWNKERKLYQKVQRTPAKKRPAAIQAALPKLGNYPLRPYLEYQLILSNLSPKSGPSVHAFQRAYPEMPLSRTLQADWLKALYNKKQWKTYLKEYDRLPLYGSTQLCRQQRVRINTGDKNLRKKAMTATDALWLVGKSQPKACDPLFKQWRKAGHLDSAKALQRFWLSVEKGNYGLARYLQRYVTKRSDKAHVKRFWEIRKNPALLFRQVRKTDNLHTLAYGLKRLVRKQPERTINYWLQVRKVRKLNTVQHAAIDTMLAKRLVTNDSDKRLRLIARLDPLHQLPDVTEAHLRLLLQQQDWPLVSALIDQLPEENQQEEIWQYWKAVALINSPYKTDARKKTAHKQADKLLKQLASERQYYGYLAATLTGQPYQLRAEQPKTSYKARKKLESNPSILRAVELERLNKTSQARSEWRNALSKMSESEQKQATLLASRLGWHFTAIVSAAQAGAWNLVDARFPRPWADTFRKMASKRKIDENWAIAIARQESAFNSQARSRVGARGLMQLMPRTARETARKHNVRYRSVNQLLKPSTNISLGTAYLSDMLKKFDGNRVLASAAYNAGPHRVTRWMKERGNLPLDVWIESIPFNETRKYVKNVLTYRVIYQLDAGIPGQFMEKNEVARLSIEPLDAKQQLVLAPQAARRTLPQDG